MDIDSFEEENDKWSQQEFSKDESESDDEILFESDDIIDQFEKESESLTSLEDEPLQEESEDNLEYDIQFEDPSTEEEPSDSIDDFDFLNEPEEPAEEESFDSFDVIQEETVEEPEETIDPLEYETAEEEQEYPQEPAAPVEYNDPTASFNPDNTALGDIFSQMENDARAQVENSESENVDPLAPAVVDSNGNPIAAAVTVSPDGTTKAAVVIPPKKKKKLGAYKIPTDLLTQYDENEYWIIDEETRQASLNLQETLKEFSIQAEITGIRKGPVVTMFEILPAPGVKLSKIVGLADNIALRLAAKAVRIVAPIPGKRAVGIEIPNRERAIVSFRECIEQNRPEWKKMAVPVILGKDIQGETQIMDLVKTPHLLIAGSTGAGKSVCVNTMILSILYKRSPSDVKMILIDPKVVELKLYNNIPHLLTPVITESKKAMQALQYCLCEMERRYAVLDSLGCRDISSYNKKIIDQHIATEKLPYLIVIIDEFADLMATTGKQLEGVVARLCAMSRAVGIHLVLATQRPSVDVITGLIKANIPSRVAFMVAAKTDSRIIIDQVGAEKLLGKGDMLYASATDPFPVRIQGTLVTDQEVEDVVEAVKEWGEPEYIDDEIFVDDEEDESNGQMSLFNDGADDPLYDKALDIVIQAGKASASYIQRRLSIGYNRAARLVELMEERGIVGPANGSKPREIIHMP
ncbi:MAG: DNA translocase FtsK [Treponema sp.]|nr:DNA translocase FtsK [Candidatus Treponema equi]